MNARHQQRSQAIVTAVASFMLLLGFCGPVRSAERNTLAHDLRAAVKLSAHSATRAEAFRALQDLQHRDSRVTYIHGLLLVERYRYPQGLQAINRAIESDKGNLTAWKTRIWLEVVTKDYDKALGTMESLSQLMQTSSAEAKCRDYCNFMGQVFGYLEGPGQKRAFVRKVADAEKRIVGGLSKTRYNVFETARAGIASDYSHRNNQIAQLLDTARSNQAESRKSQIADLATEGKGATTELARVEDRREVVRNLATAERNEIAATRDKSYHGSGAMGGSAYSDATQRGPMYHRPPNAKKDRGWVLDHNYDRYRLGASGFRAGSAGYRDKGLDDRHYADVNRRAAQDDHRLDRLKSDLNTRLQRIASDKKRLMLKPNTGASDLVRSKIATAKALSTYVAVPVDPQREVQQVLASFDVSPPIDAVASSVAIR